MDKYLELLATRGYPLRLDESHSVYSGTTPPNPYSQHLIRQQQPLKMGYNPGFIDGLIEKFKADLKKHPGLTSGTFDAEMFKNRHAYSLTSYPAAFNECSVVNAQHELQKIAGRCATVAHFHGATVDDIQRGVIEPNVSGQPETKADIVAGVMARPSDGPAIWGALWPAIISPVNLTHPFFNVLSTDEYKSIIAGNLRIFICILIIVWCMRKGLILGFWTEGECNGCPQYRESHTAAEKPNEPQFQLPPDSRHSTISDYLDEADEDDQDADIMAEISRLLDMLETYEADTAVNESQKKAMKGSTAKTKDKDHADLMPALIEAARELGVPEDVIDTMDQWFTNAIYMLIQIWGHMVRHNTTIARLTSHNIGIVVIRERKEQRMTISKVFNHEEPLMKMTALAHLSLKDAIERHQDHVDNNIPWEADPFHRRQSGKRRAEEAPAEDDDEEGQEKDEEANRNSRRSKRLKGHPKLPRRDDRNDRGNGGAGASGSSGGPQGNGSSGNDGKTDGAGGTGTSIGQFHRGNRLQVDAQKVHLGFQLQNGHLWSTAFSCFERIASSISETLSSLDGIDTVQTAHLNETLSKPQLIHHVGILLGDFVAKGPIGIVWAGKMILEGTNGVELPIIVKMATAKEGPQVEEVTESEEAEVIRREGMIYELISSSQGRDEIIPRYYGTFKDKVGSVALVYENIGTVLKSFGLNFFWTPSSTSTSSESFTVTWSLETSSRVTMENSG
ncbi:hypothetical protein C8J56DRAFT_1030568 [Mycena floridula]|nr:hypothetical protein C8J56DRAFT_1030568 [Mycena floridula]